jgi:hypothetical protein
MQTETLAETRKYFMLTRTLAEKRQLYIHQNLCPERQADFGNLVKPTTKQSQSKPMPTETQEILKASTHQKHRLRKENKGLRDTGTI